MNISLNSEGFWQITSDVVSLGTIRPVVNGVLLNISDFQVAHGVSTHYSSPDLGDGKFIVEISGDRNITALLAYSLENLPEDFVLNSFGVRFEGIESCRAFLRNGYFSWDGASYIEVEKAEKPTYQGYAMTQFLPHYGKGSMIIGFDTHEFFQYTFSFDLSHSLPVLTVETLWDQKDGYRLEGLERYESDLLDIIEHPQVEEGLREWARLVADNAFIQPRKSAPPITGWCSWYNLYAAITEENILEHLHGAAEVARRENLPLRVLQIDDGFTPEMGDWLDVKPQFPRGMKPLLDDIRAAGFIPGLWIGPFMVGNRSRLYQQHPDWVVIDRQTGKPLVQMAFYGEFRWHKRSEEYYILDTTHPEAFEYLRQVFRTWRHEWGCEYFKTDFMQFGSEHGADRAIYHTPGMTRIEIWRRTAEMIREEIGDAIWLGCGCPLFASIGLVDGIRIGKDVGVNWSGNQSAQSLIQDQAPRNYGNGIFWQADPDCVLLRERFHHLTDTELTSLAIFAGMMSGVLTTSDALHELSPERIELLRLLLELQQQPCEFPFLGQPDPVMVQAKRDRSAVFIFNTGDEPVQREYMLSQLGIEGSRHARQWRGETLDQPIEQLSVNLNPHEGALWFFS